MADLISMLSACGATEGEATDEYFQNTTLLLHGDGTNGAQNNTFLDSSTNNFTITRNGNTTQGSFSPFSKPDGRWGNFFDGSGDYLSVANNSVFDFGSGAMTMECWFYLTGDAPSVDNERIATLLCAIRTGAGALNTDYSFGIGGNSTVTGTSIIFNRRSGNTLTSLTYTATITKNSWHHVAAVRNGSDLSIYYDGARVAQNTSFSGDINTGGWPFKVGGLALDSTYQYFFPGYIANVRVLKGTAQYSGSTYTVPTAPLTAITNTSLLTCQSNRFKDNSTNNFTITPNGDVKATPFSPFPITTAYDPAVNGGSGYFDGTGDYLTSAQNSAFNLGTGAFTVEAFFYVNSFSVSNRIIGLGNGANGSSPVTYTGWSLNFNTSFVNLYRFDGSVTNRSASVTVTTGQWYHLVACRDSSSNFALFLNGNRVLSQSSATTSYNNVNSDPLYLGRIDDGAGGFSTKIINAYVGDTRVVAGSTVYDPTQTTLVVPTAPLTAIANTSLLTNFTNAGIFDNTGFNNLETVGNAQIDTTVKKYGTGSMEFDGTGDYLLMNGGDNFAFGTGDFTVEFWYYSNNTGSQQLLYDSRPSGTNGNYITFYKSSSNVLELYVNNSVRATGSTSIASGTWYHVALCRSGTSTRMFLNGTQEGSTYTDSTNYLNGANRPAIGTDGNTLGNLPLNGYIDDLRITKGIARYTSNFTAPTAAFPDIGE